MAATARAINSTKNANQTRRNSRNIQQLEKQKQS